MDNNIWKVKENELYATLECDLSNVSVSQCLDSMETFLEKYSLLKKNIIKFQLEPNLRDSSSLKAEIVCSKVDLEELDKMSEPDRIKFLLDKAGYDISKIKEISFGSTWDESKKAWKIIIGEVGETRFSIEDSTTRGEYLNQVCRLLTTVLRFTVYVLESS